MAKCIYAGNLSWSVKHEDLLEYMLQAGDVVSAEVMSHPDGRSKGWGLVEFLDVAGAANAVSKFNDQELMGRKIFLREDREVNGVEVAPPPPRQEREGRGGKGRSRGRGRGRATTYQELAIAEVTGGTTLFVGNLPWSTKWHELKDIFAEFNVKFADVKTGYDGRSRGYGIVRFDTEEDAAAAVAMNGTELDGRAILVRFDRQQTTEE